MAEDTTKKNFFKNAVKWVRDHIIMPMVQNTDYIHEIYHNLGLADNGQQINIPAGTLTNIDNYIKKNSEDADIDALMAVVEDLKGVVQATMTFAQAAENNDVKASDIVNYIVEFFLLEGIRDGNPHIYSVIALMEGVDELGESEGGIVDFFKTIGLYFKDFGLAHDLNDEAQAQRLSDVYFLSAIVLLELLGLIPALKEAVKKIVNEYVKHSRYGLDLPPTGVGSPLANQLSKRILSLSISGKTTIPNGDKLTGTAYLSMMFVPKVNQGGAFLMGLGGKAGIAAKLSDTWAATIDLDAGEAFIRIGNGGGVTGGPADGSVKLGFKRTTGDGNKAVFGSPKGTRLEIGSGEISAKASATDLDFKVKFKESAIFVMPDNGFLKSFMDEQGMKIGIDLGIGYSFKKKGLYLDGGSGFSITLPMHLKLGPVTIQALYLQLKSTADPDPKGFFIETSTAFSVVLGPLAVAVDRMGIKMTFENHPNTPSPWDFKFKIQPPRGIGLRVDATIVKGGGFLFFDPENGEYAGALELSIQNTIQIGAIAIITTKNIPNADGTTSDGFSLLIILSVSFTPGFSLGFGFFLTGLGGLLGLHRTINADKLLESVRNNAIDSILFPEDIVANASSIIHNIQGIFPPRKDQFIIGLMARISWGAAGLVDLQFGFAIEFSSPVKLAILGVLKIQLGNKDLAIVRLQINFIGLIDFDKQYLAFDASLYDSRLLFLTLEGDLAVRLNWGSDAGFVVSVGGFHPSFTPPAALNVPKMKRLTISILNPNPKIALTAYMAVTSNTVQFGAKIELKFKAGPFGIEGYLGFDVLFQFSPFHFIATISAGISIKAGSTTLFTLTLDFELSGPTPWRAKGSVSFKILFFTIKINFDVTWGDEATESSIGVQVMPLVAESAKLNRNWIAELPPNRYDLITLRELPHKEDLIVMQAFGSLRMTQNIMPLNLPINKFGNLKPIDTQKVDFAEVRIGGKKMEIEEIREKFAPANFKEMPDDDKLKSPSFDNQKSGVRVKATDAIHTNYGVNLPVEYEVHTSDFDPNPVKMPFFKLFDMGMFQAMAGGGLISKSELSMANLNKVTRTAGAVSMQNEQFVIVNAGTLKPFDANLKGSTEIESQTALANILSAQPHLKDDLVVVSAYHLV